MGTIRITNGSLDGRFRSEVDSLAHTNIGQCYQCGKCTAGCPIGPEMDLGPTKVMQLIKLGQMDTVLRSATIWICASCETCTTRCPQEVDIARTMDALRALALRNKMRGGDRSVRVFHRHFLLNIARFGRVHELGLVAAYKTFGLAPFADVDKAPAMLLKGLIKLRPHRAALTDALRRKIREVARGGGEE